MKNFTNRGKKQGNNEKHMSLEQQILNYYSNTIASGRWLMMSAYPVKAERNWLCGKEKRGRVIFKAKSTITYGGADSFFKGIKSDSNDH